MEYWDEFVPVLSDVSVGRPPPWRAWVGKKSWKFPAWPPSKLSTRPGPAIAAKGYGAVPAPWKYGLPERCMTRTQEMWSLNKLTAAYLIPQHKFFLTKLDTNIWYLEMEIQTAIQIRTSEKAKRPKIIHRFKKRHHNYMFTESCHSESSLMSTGRGRRLEKGLSPRLYLYGYLPSSLGEVRARFWLLAA